MTIHHRDTGLERLLRHSDWLTALARRLVVDAATADDLVQETWVAALCNPPDPDRPAQPWLASVLRRLASMRDRRAAQRIDLTPETSAPAASRVAERVEQEQGLARKVLELEQPYRDTVLLRYYEGLPDTRIAQRMGVPTATVRTRLRRGLEKLRGRLEKESGGHREWMQALAPVACWKAPQPLGLLCIVGGLIMGKVAVISGVAAALALLVWLGTGLNEEEESGPAAVHADREPMIEPPKVGTTEPAVVDGTRRPVKEPQAGGADPGAPPELATLTIRAVEKGTNNPLESIFVMIEPIGSGGGRPDFSASDKRESWPKRLDTGADGLAVFDLPGNRTFQASLYAATGATPRVGGAVLPVEPLSPGDRRELVVELPVGPDLLFIGRIVDDEGEPVRDATVTVPEGYATVVKGKRIVPTFAATSTDATGYFVLEGISWGRQHARIDVPGFGRTLVVLTTGHDTRDKAQVIHLLRAASLDATVTAETGQSVGEFILHVTTNFGNLIRPRTSAGDTTGFDPVWTANAGPDLRFTLTDLPPGVPLTVEIRRGAEVMKSWAENVSLGPGEHRVIKWTLGTGTAVEGIAVDERREPVPGLELWLLPAKKGHPSGKEAPRYFSGRDSKVAKRTTTDSQGRFAFEDIEPGTWYCGPAHVDVGTAPTRSTLPAPLGRIINVEPDWGTRDLVIEVTYGLYIEGLVLDSDKAPFGGNWVRLSSGGLSRIRDFQASTSGEFIVGPLVPGEVQLSAFGSGRFGNSPLVTAAAGDTDVILQLMAAGLLRGRIIDSDTGEGCRAELRLIDSSKPLGYERWIHSKQETGAFEFESLQTGTYHLLARADDGGIALLRNIEVKAGSVCPVVKLHLERGAVLQVRSGDDREWNFTLYHDGLAVGHGFIGAGKESQQTLFSGTTRVLYRRDRSPGEAYSEFELEVEVEPGERRELMLPPDE